MNKVGAGDRRGERTGAGRGKGEFTKSKLTPLTVGAGGGDLPCCRCKKKYIYSSSEVLSTFACFGSDVLLSSQGL